MGYPQSGLEVWAYPFQILSGYQVGFRPEGSATETDGRLLLKRLIERPDSVVRIYTGPDYVIRETIFVPINQPAAVISYSVQSDHPIFIYVHFKPVLNLMWPGAIGGQSSSWNPHLPGYLIEEPTHDLRAFIASPDIVLHDDIVNTTFHRSGNLSFALKPQAAQNRLPGAPAVASVYITLLQSPRENPALAIKSLETNTAKFWAVAQAHYARLAENALRISTPDKAVNSALAWAEVALDQAWVCNPQLGCGIVAGYGPSRGARRPQYAWFFAGDGLIAVNALISAGEYARARDELLFIEKYQDPKTGMIWHELSQSAGYIDWSKYPYMFVHVDISFDYLNAIAHYVFASGDRKFATDHWQSVQSAYRYCLSLVGPDGLPHIPTGKEGVDEQHRPAEDLGLSVSWIAATSSFAALAKATGHPELTSRAFAQNQRARQAVATHFWDTEHHFWISGYTRERKPIFTRRSGPADAITQNIFSAQQNQRLLNQIASSTFRTDWGVRSVATNSPIYNPWSYASGSVSALHSADIAAMFWAADRPNIAWSIWQDIVPWNTLDSVGHIHEVLAGNYYREQTESVPEQTWSSAGLLRSAVRGLLGLTVNGESNSATFRPHLPAQWNRISIGNIHLPHSTLALTMRQTIDSVDFDVTNDGAPTALSFQPEIPLGAHVTSFACEGHPIPTHMEPTEEDEHAAARITAPSGVSHCSLRFAGGVSIIISPHTPQVGGASAAPKLTQITLHDRTLVIHADVRPAANSTLLIRTPWKIASITGGTIRATHDDLCDIQIG
ncbi:MAG: hypothetical protein WAM66_09455 [Acidobacteriaceae bacterium]